MLLFNFSHFSLFSHFLKEEAKLDNKQFGKELEKRTRLFAVRIIHLSTKLPNTPEGRVVGSNHRCRLVFQRRGKSRL